MVSGTTRVRTDDIHEHRRTGLRRRTGRCDRHDQGRSSPDDRTARADLDRRPHLAVGLRHGQLPRCRFARTAVGYAAFVSEGTPKVEGHAGLMWIRGSGTCRDWHGIRYKLGMSGRNVGATQLSLNVATIPPGGVAGAHIHVDFEAMLY